MVHCVVQTEYDNPLRFILSAFDRHRLINNAG